MCLLEEGRERRLSHKVNGSMKKWANERKSQNQQYNTTCMYYVGVGMFKCTIMLLHIRLRLAFLATNQVYENTENVYFIGHEYDHILLHTHV